VWSATAQSAQKNFRHLTIQEGLSQNSGIDLVQDGIGYLWIATQDGLNRFDGYQFKVYKRVFEDITRPSYSKLGDLHVDASGRLWIVSISGIPERYNPETDSFETTTPAKKVRSIFHNPKNGSLYMGTDGDGLWSKTEEHVEWKHYDLPWPGISIYDGLVDRNGLLWLACGSLVCTFDGLVFNQIPIQKRSGEINFSSLEQDEQGNIWIGSFGSGLFVKTTQQADIISAGELSSFKGALPDDLNILDLEMTRDGILWLATYGNGALELHLGSQQIYTHRPSKGNPNSIAYNDILSILEDQQGVVWLGTDGGGVSYYDNQLVKFNGFVNQQVPDPVQIDVVRAIIQDQQDKIWLGTSGKGLTVYDPNAKQQPWKMYQMTDENSISGNRIMSLLESSSGDILIGTQGNGLDVYRIGENRFQSYTVGDRPNDIPDDTVWDIFEDENQQIWLATRNGGLCQFDLNSGIVKQFNRQNSDLPADNIRVIIQGRHANEFILGLEEMGICLFDQNKNTFQTIHSKSTPAITSNLIKALYLNKDYLWIGTNGSGLDVYHLNTGQIRNFSKKDGLPNEVIYGVLPDEKGALWLSTNFGIVRFTPPLTVFDSLSNPVVETFDYYNGLQSFEFNTGAYFKSKDGRLYFGGIEGFNWFDPNDIQKDSQEVSIILTYMKAGDQIYDAPVSILDFPKLELPFNANKLSFTFATSNLSLAQKNQYQYQLEGYESTFRESTSRNYIEYTNLEPGEYTLKVRASNADGIWNKEPEEIRFLIHPPFYKTSLAYLLYFLVVSGVLYLLYLRYQLRWKLRLEQQEADQLREMDAFKNKLFANISHEFRNPLTVIQGLSSLEKVEEKERKILHSNSQKLLTLINQILDLSKLESQKVEIYWAKGNLVFFLRYLCESMESLAHSKGIELNFETTLEVFETYFDEEKYRQIFSNLLGNAIKFTPSGGRINCTLQHLNNQIRVVVSDTGIGMTPEEQAQIFDRYYQGKPEQFSGTGIGLTLVYELVKLMGGQIEVQSRIGTGTTFEVLLPIHQPAETMEETRQTVPSQNVLTDLNLDRATILVVEDREEIRTYLQHILSPNYEVHLTTDGQHAWQWCKDQIPDLIITDVVMPNMDGYALCAKLKSTEETCHIPIIMLTAKTDKESRLRGLEEGADAYLEKPFEPEELQIVIQKLLDLRKRLQGRYQQLEVSEASSPSPEEAFLHPEDTFLRKLNLLLDAELDNEKLSIPDIHEKLICSKMQLYRKVKAMTGLSPTHYVRQYRLYRAKLLLRDPNLRVNEVAFQVGFNSSSYFSRAFKQAFGMSPLAYQEEVARGS